MLHDEDLTDFVISVLGEKPAHIIINGTGRYTYHGSIADCGITGRKLACDFYSTACPIGGGSPWTKDASKADLTLNVYARILACENLADNDECFVYLSSCIGRAELPSGLIKTIKNGIVSYRDLWCNQKPSALIICKIMRQKYIWNTELKRCRLAPFIIKNIESKASTLIISSIRYCFYNFFSYVVNNGDTNRITCLFI